MIARIPLLLLLLAAAAFAQDRPPNLVYILADDLGYGEVGCYGQEKIRTPHLDRMATEGMRFTQHYSGAPVCAPARCVLMTGLHTGHAHVRGNRGRPVIGQLPLPADTVTLPKLLKARGYATCAVGKWGLGGPGTSGHPNLQGFDRWFGYLDQWNAHTHYPRYLYRDAEKVELDGKTYSHDLFTEEALAFLRSRKPGEPYFLYVAYAVPHVSLQVPADSLAEYEGKWPETPYPGAHYAGHPTPRAAYAAMVTRMDRDIGRILAAVDDNTIVVFASDNGPTYAGGADSRFFASTAGLRGLKGSLYEGGIRIPMIVRWPGRVKAGAVSDHVSAFCDVLPTFVETAGGAVPAGLDGISFLPALLGQPQPAHDHLYWEDAAGPYWQATRMGDWKALRPLRRPAEPIQLYDLRTDRDETTDVAAGHPDVVARAREIFAAARVESEFFPTTPPVADWRDDGVWVGPSCWANRLQDWQVKQGRLLCVEGRLPMRTVHLLTHRPARAPFSMRVVTGPLALGPGGTGATGFLLGAGGAMDYRAAALIHGVPGPGAGIFAGVDARGRAFVRDNEKVHADAPPAGVLPRTGWKVVHVDSAADERPGSNAIDGDAATFWHSEWRRRKPDHPHEIRIDLGKPTTFHGFLYVPRQTPAPGRIDGYAFFGDGDAPLVEGRFPDGAAPQRVTLPAPVTARTIRLVSRSAHGGRPVAAVAEIYLLDAEGVRRAPATFPDDVQLKLSVEPKGARAVVRLAAHHPITDAKLSEAALEVDAARVRGNVALVSHPGPDGARFWFRDWRVEGVAADPSRRLGPVIGTQYTLSGGVLKLSAQLMPAGPGRVALEVRRGEKWVEVGRAEYGPPDFTAVFRVPDWKDGDVRYRVGDREGTIRHDPVEKDTLVLAALSCNHNNSHRIGRAPFDWTRGIWFPHADLAAAVARHDPDLLFFAGDQIYEGRSPTPADPAHLELDYLYKWYLWHWAWRDLVRDRPCVTIPDDHDVFQGNLWGEGGRPAKRDSDGGYVHPASFVNMVQRTQTAHLPDPYDPTPVAQGIGVHYTGLRCGRVGFAILEDRKFKSGCGGGRLPPTGTNRPDHINDPAFDMAKADVPGLALLGERQLGFLEAWAAPRDGVALRAVLSQTPFANLATHHGGALEYLRADLDSNGWPQGGRERALRAIRKAGAIHVAGDQHLATLVRHGIDAYDDGPWSFCVPSIANFYPRAWNPPGADSPLGRHRDGFGNLVTVHAVANPGPSGHEPAELHDTMPGYGIVRFDAARGEITFECWPRHGGPQYEGWPKTVRVR